MKVLKPRHTPIPDKGKLCRSYGMDSETGEDIVVELRKGEIEIRREPTDRKIKRGEKLPNLVLNVQELADNLNSSVDTTEAEVSVQAILDEILLKLPVAKFEEESGNKGYKVKAWLYQALKEAVSDQTAA